MSFYIEDMGVHVFFLKIKNKFSVISVISVIIIGEGL